MLPQVVPSLFATMEVPGFINTLQLSDAGSRACLLLIDGLGARLLEHHADRAPFLMSLWRNQRELSVGFPSTTATSITSLGTGLPCGQHGVVGYAVAVPGQAGEPDRMFNVLRWSLQDVDPHQWQPQLTAFEQATAAGVTITQVVPTKFVDSPFNAMAMRGVQYVGADCAGERVAAALHTIGESSRSLTYVYYGDLDHTAHQHGVDSEATALQLEHVDLMVKQLTERLPADTSLWITGDHGLVDVAQSDLIDVAREPELAVGVRLLGGEPRARYLYCEPGAVDSVVTTWSQRLEGLALVRTREQAVAEGWFGPNVHDRVMPRIGDVVVATYALIAVVDSRTDEPGTLSLIGMHGSLTDDEVLVPLIEVQAR